MAEFLTQAQLLKKIGELNTKISKLEEGHRAELEAKIAELEEATTALSTANVKVEEQKVEMERLQAQVAELEKKIELLEKLQQENEELAKRIEELNEIIDSMTATGQDDNAELEALRAQVAKLESRIISADEALKLTTAELGDKVAKLEELNKQLADELAETKQVLERTQQELERERNEKRGAKISATKSKNRVEQLTEERNAANARATQAEAERDAANRRAETASTKSNNPTGFVTQMANSVYNVFLGATQNTTSVVSPDGQEKTRIAIAESKKLTKEDKDFAIKGFDAKLNALKETLKRLLESATDEEIRLFLNTFEGVGDTIRGRAGDKPVNAEFILKGEFEPDNLTLIATHLISVYENKKYTEELAELEVQRQRADNAEARATQAETDRDAQTTRAETAEGERDQAKTRAEEAENKNASLKKLKKVLVPVAVGVAVVAVGVGILYGVTQGNLNITQGDLTTTQANLTVSQQDEKIASFTGSVDILKAQGESVESTASTAETHYGIFSKMYKTEVVSVSTSEANVYESAYTSVQDAKNGAITISESLDNALTSYTTAVRNSDNEQIGHYESVIEDYKTEMGGYVTEVKGGLDEMIQVSGYSMEELYDYLDEMAKPTIAVEFTEQKVNAYRQYLDLNGKGYVDAVSFCEYDKGTGEVRMVVEGLDKNGKAYSNEIKFTLASGLKTLTVDQLMAEFMNGNVINQLFSQELATSINGTTGFAQIGTSSVSGQIEIKYNLNEVARPSEGATDFNPTAIIIYRQSDGKIAGYQVVTLKPKSVKGKVSEEFKEGLKQDLLDQINAVLGTEATMVDEDEIDL